MSGPSTGNTNCEVKARSSSAVTVMALAESWPDTGPALQHTHTHSGQTGRSRLYSKYTVKAVIFR